jgi:hypothetical protein
MNDKIKELLKNAEQSDAIAINKWRIENREQLRKERKEKLKELMEKDKQQTAVEWLEDRIKNQHLYPFASIDELSEQAKEMEILGKEMSYSDGYAEGYKRALEVMEWYIKNHISGMVQEHIGEANKMIEGGNND